MPEKKHIIPLFVEYRDLNKGGSVLHLSASQEDLASGKAEIVTAEHVERLLEMFDDQGLPEFHVHDMPALARASVARDMRRHDVEIGQMRDGEGIVMICDPHQGIEDFGFLIHDHRSSGLRQVELYGSWEVDRAEYDAYMADAGSDPRTDLSDTLAKMIAEMPPEILRQTQISLERQVGAAVSFLSLEPADVIEELGLSEDEAGDVDAAAMQRAMTTASRKFEISETYQAARDAVADRFMEAQPELSRKDTDGTDFTP